MTGEQLAAQLRASLDQPMPLPAGGETSARHRLLMEIGRNDLSLARLAEAHWDAVAILAEAGRTPESGVIYAVWASEIPSEPLKLEVRGNGYAIHGTKLFCSGAGLVDRALVTIGFPRQLLIDVDLRTSESSILLDNSSWKTSAFQEIRTSTATFAAAPVSENDVIGDPGWYLTRTGFWHGACGPAACWAGGAAGLVDWAMGQKRDDPHTLAHPAAMQSSVWALKSYLYRAGMEIDQAPDDSFSARLRALTLRHLVEQECTSIIRRLPRAYGPSPLAMNEIMSRRYLELDLYLRQSHAERDLEALGRGLLSGALGLASIPEPR
jgi:alkylation response protein AidB-like acyl-CoA dehydrogenase